jgi:hypothetical protein
MGTVILELIGMEPRDGDRYSEAYWDGDTRWVQLYWSLLEWSHEMGTGIVKFTGMETRDGDRYIGAYWDGATRWAHDCGACWD